MILGRAAVSDAPRVRHESSRRVWRWFRGAALVAFVSEHIGASKCICRTGTPRVILNTVHGTGPYTAHWHDWAGPIQEFPQVKVVTVYERSRRSFLCLLPPQLYW